MFLIIWASALANRLISFLNNYERHKDNHLFQFTKHVCLLCWVNQILRIEAPPQQSPFFFFLTLATWEHVCVVKNLDLSVNAPLLPCLQSPLYKLANMFMSFSPLGSLLPTFYSQKVRAQDAIYWSFWFFFWKIISEITLPSQHTFIQLILSGIILLLITSSNSFFLILRHVHYYTAEALSHTLYHTLFSSRIILFQ